MAIQLDELITLSEADAQTCKQLTINDELQKENNILEKRNESLQKCLDESIELRKETESKIEELEKLNQSLQNYIQGLGQDLSFCNTAGKLSQVGARHQRRKIVEVKTKVEKALWFSKTFGLEIHTVIFDDDKGLDHILSYAEKERKSYKDLSDADQQKIKNILFVLDKFCIGDEAYHELSMLAGNENLPRSYLIKQCKNDLNRLCHISRTPGAPQGAQLDFLSELESVIQDKV